MSHSNNTHILLKLFKMAVDGQNVASKGVLLEIIQTIQISYVFWNLKFCKVNKTPKKFL